MLLYNTIRYTFAVREGGSLHMPFEIKSDRKETENKTIRFPLQLVKDIEVAIQDKDVTFSGFVIQACQYALDNMKKAEDE